MLVDVFIIGYIDTMLKYTIFNHTADLGIEITGRTKKELFAKALWSLMDVLIERREPVEGISNFRRRTLTVEGSDIADLLVNYLREVLYLFNGKSLMIGKCEITECGNKKLAARLSLEPYDPKKHVMKTEIKAVTYHGLSVKKRKRGWMARVIFDV